MAKVDLTAERLRELLDYDPGSGLFTWKAPLSRRVKAGMQAGNITTGGYVSIGILGKNWLAHRLAWLYVNGVWPSEEVDHKNGSKTDNRICNLRDVSRSMNQQNRRVGHGKSRLLGAHWFQKTKQWHSTIHTGGKNRFLGLFDTPEEAHRAYLEAKRRLHEGNTI